VVIATLFPEAEPFTSRAVHERFTAPVHLPIAPAPPPARRPLLGRMRAFKALSHHLNQSEQAVAPWLQRRFEKPIGRVLWAFHCLFRLDPSTDRLGTIRPAFSHKNPLAK
jgi:hypothetical protein